MGMITWNTDVNAPCCPGEIIGPRYRDDETGRFTNDRILIQTDWDYPVTARSFGWDMRTVQSAPYRECPQCGYRENIDDCDDEFCPDCPDTRMELHTSDCEHRGTDGTVDCPECGLTASAFISAAGDWLDENDGATAIDPGYFG
jgi:hypothetical protein